jgi:hypothetical protein
MKRLRSMGELAMEILHRQSVAYTLQNDEDVDVSCSESPALGREA